MKKATNKEIAAITNSCNANLNSTLFRFINFMIWVKLFRKITHSPKVFMLSNA